MAAKFGLFIGAKLVCTGDDVAGLLPYTVGTREWRIVRRADEVVMVQLVTDRERTLYAVAAWVAAHPGATMVDVSMKFNISLGGVGKLLNECERAGLINGVEEVRNGFKRVRVYSAA